MNIKQLKEEFLLEVFCCTCVFFLSIYDVYKLYTLGAIVGFMVSCLFAVDIVRSWFLIRKLNQEEQKEKK